jgi:hypothetical protein
MAGCAAAAVVAACGAGQAPRPRSAAAPLVVRVGGSSGTAVVPHGFLGLSLEYYGVTAYAGADPHAIDPVFVRLVRELAPNGGVTLRIGGDSTDLTWWPEPGLPRPAGVSYALSPAWTATVAALARAARARLILGIDLEAGSPSLAGTEARHLVAGLGRSRIAALEIGNEPEQYAARWYRGPDGRWVPGRAPGYDASAYARELARWRAVLPSLPLAAPATGSPSWLHGLLGRLVGTSSVAQITVHRYPLSRCDHDPRSPAYPTLAHLIAPAAARGSLAPVARAAALAHAHGLVLRVDELNSVTCQGRYGVSDTFASALWMLDALFALEHAGVDGVNVHVWPGAVPNELFTFSHGDGRWTGAVRPAYYGMLMFARAAPAGSRLLHVRTSAGGLRVWATRGPDGTTRIVLINFARARARTVRVSLARGPLARGRAPARIERLRAAGLPATRGVTLGGQSFGAATSTGALAGTLSVAAVAWSAGGYTVSVPAASAALLTVPG